MGVTLAIHYTELPEALIKLGAPVDAVNGFFSKPTSRGVATQKGLVFVYEGEAVHTQASIKADMLAHITKAAGSSQDPHALLPAFEKACEVCQKPWESEASEKITAHELLKKSKTAPAKVAEAVDIQKLMAGTPVGLDEADHLYQPVRGSSGGSIYFCIGLDESGVRLAARWVKAKLSIRMAGFEGEVPSDAKILGFGSKQGYASMHIELSPGPEKQEFEVRATLGTVLATLMRKPQTLSPDVTHLKGAGQ